MGDGNPIVDPLIQQPEVMRQLVAEIYAEVNTVRTQHGVEGLKTLRDMFKDFHDAPPQNEAIALPEGLSTATLINVVVAIHNTAKFGKRPSRRGFLLALLFLILVLMIILPLRKLCWRNMNLDQKEYFDYMVYFIAIAAIVLDLVVAALNYYDTSD